MIFTLSRHLARTQSIRIDPYEKRFPHEPMDSSIINVQYNPYQPRRSNLPDESRCVIQLSSLSIHLGSNACDLVKAATNVCKREWPRSLTLARMQCKINQVACSIEGHQNVFVYDSKLRTVNASIQI